MIEIRTYFNFYLREYVEISLYLMYKQMNLKWMRYFIKMTRQGHVIRPPPPSKRSLNCFVVCEQG